MMMAQRMRGVICDKLASEDERIKVIHKENGGLVNARKEGAKIATGEYLTFVDGDDWVTQDLYEKIIKDIQKSRVDIHVSGLYEYRDGEKRQIVNELETGIYVRDDKWEDIFLTVLFNSRMKTECIPGIVIKTIKTSLFQKSMIDVDDGIHDNEDTLFSIVCMREAESIQINNDSIGYVYRLVDESMSHCYDKRYWDYIERYCENIDIILEIEKNRNPVKERIITDRIYMILRYIDRELFYSDEQNVLKKAHRLKNVFFNHIKLYEALKTQKICKLKISGNQKIILLLLKFDLFYLLCFIKYLRQDIRGILSRQK